MAKKKTATQRHKVDSAAPDEADGVRVGEEPVPGMRLRCICRGHQGTIGRIAWSPCGRFIASPSSDKTIRTWDANDGKCLKMLKGHEGRVYGVAWSADSSRIASAGEDEKIRLWELTSAKAVATSQTLRDRINALAWSSSVDLILAAVGTGTVHAFDPDTLHEQREIEAHGNPVICASLSPSA